MNDKLHYPILPHRKKHGELRITALPAILPTANDTVEKMRNSLSEFLSNLKQMKKTRAMLGHG